MNLGTKGIGDACPAPRTVGDQPKGYVGTGMRRLMGFESPGPIQPYSSFDISVRSHMAFRADRFYVEPAIARFFCVAFTIGVCPQEVANGRVPASFFARRDGALVTFDVCEMAVDFRVTVWNIGKKQHPFRGCAAGELLEPFREWFDPARVR